MMADEANEEGNVSSHGNHQHSLTALVPMSAYETAELTWENGQVAMNEIGEIFPTPSTNPTWADTLESLVHQATWQKQNQTVTAIEHHEKVGSVVASTGGKWREDSGLHAQFPASSLAKKRTRSDPDHCGMNYCNDIRDDEMANHSACATANAALGTGNDTTFVTWNSFDSSRSVKTKTTDEDSAYTGSKTQGEERETKSEPGCSHSGRRGKAAAIHNQSERKRRDRINQKMKALQKLVPNASKTDKASMLDEVIEYLKQLQAQVQMMSAGNMPILMQQHLQMSLLAQMGMGVELGMCMGMVDMSSIARSIPQQQAHLLHPCLAATKSTSVPPAFVLPPVIHQLNSDPGNCSSAPLPDPCSTFLAQPMNTDLYSKMAAVYGQQVNKTTQAAGGGLRPNHVQRV